ncbi:acyl carrier protein [Streptomyces sp. AJS327]|uniref:acyl carrier protein n=1 Tax=Streptomyces sp. AJS327 TaxID=2545265 RepID=UPI0015E051C0|nr:acyl carrier protein [Streptomyces sp. AJS327]MBA0053324.1 acyl carrier protein [Streptomyces sp. AJS327]
MVSVSMVGELNAAKLGGEVSRFTLNAEAEFESAGLSGLRVADIIHAVEDATGIESDPSGATGTRIMCGPVDRVDLVGRVDPVGPVELVDATRVA